ncbi:MAG: flagellar hook-length control protein FliK, partial [Sulfurimonas sp.]|nr:flagellar hook-length control protein FliK [Sulfurimonas sp.]
LVEVAKKFDIDISKITLEQVQTKSSKTQPIKEVLSAADVSKESSSTAPVSKEVAKEEKIPSVLSKEAPKQELRLAQVFKEVSQEKEQEKETPKTQTRKHQTQPTKAEAVQQTQVAQADTQNITAVKAHESKTQEPIFVSQLKETPLFKAQERSGHTTEQLVQSKQFKIEEKTPKEKADETLKLLLRGEKPTQNAVTSTPDFSVATAKVLVSNTPTQGAKSLEQLLRGEEKENTNISKLDGLSVHKADSFEVKLNEAKQMIKYLSSDVKTAIEDYKSPFTRVKVQLNPQRLGEVELTIVQRGKNLHVNISSNNAAINTLVLNANELKTQLSNNGINNASLNFSNNAQGDNSGAFGGQSQNRHHEQKAHEEYNYFGEESANEEILSSLEIVVANYA